MNLRLHWEDDRQLVVACSGEVGWNVSDALLKKLGHELDGHHAPQVLIDLEMVDFVTSAGVGGLLQVRKLIGEHGGSLMIASAPPLVAQLFKTVGLDRHIPVVESLASARELLKTASTH